MATRRESTKAKSTVARSAEYQSDLYAASGFGIDDCCLLALYYTNEWGFKPDVGESWIIRTKPGSTPDKVKFNVAFGITGAWFIRVWRSPTVAYAVSNDGRIFIARDLDALGPESWERFPFRGAVMDGIWGLDDKHVFAWYRTLKPKGEHALFWNGKTWKELPRPPGRIISMHGLSPDQVYAVGAEGLLALWNGKTWTNIAIPTKANMTSVFVAGPDEMYAVGHDKGLWEGSTAGWGRVATGPGSLYGVAKFAGEVWVGAEEHGLWKRAKNKLVCVDPDLHAQVMDCRGKVLLITSTELLAETSDGKKFTTKGQGLVCKLRDPAPKLWRRAFR